MSRTPSTPALSLDDLATDWLPRRLTQLAGLPGLNNDLGSVQIEADIVAFKHPCFPPFSAGGETTGMTLLNGKLLAQCVEHVEIRWKAFEVERRCRSGDWAMSSRTSLLPDQPGVVVELTVTNTAAESRELTLELLLSGRSRNTGKEGYAWAVPTVPTDVFSFTRNEGLDQRVTRSTAGDGVSIANDGASAHTTQCVWPAADGWKQERIPGWRRVLGPGESFVVTLLCAFHAEQAEAEAIAGQWHGRSDAIFIGARERWERLWSSAFTPGNEWFSGHLPVLNSPYPAMNRLYYNGILTLLTCRRAYPHAVIRPCYITIWPRRGEGSGYMAWDMPFTSGILARLDPDALREMLLLLMSAPMLDYQVTNFFTGEHGGWACCSHPMAIQTAAMNLTRWAGDVSWQAAPVVVKPKSVRGFEAASQGQVMDGTEARAGYRTTGLEVFRQAVLMHRTHHLEGSSIASFGDRGSYVECITTYAYGTAGHTAVQAAALEEAGALLGLDPHDAAREATELRMAALSLYRPGDGYFDCQHPDGKRVPAANLYDMALVLNALGKHMPEQVVEEMAGFARRELITPTWAHCLVPTDLDVLSGLRCDHQWAGCFSSWPPFFIMGLLRAGYQQPWMTEWLTGMAELTRQGPFAQAYWAEDVYEPEAGGAAKCFDELTQGNHWISISGVNMAQMILDGICGVTAGLDGTLELHAAHPPWGHEASLKGIHSGGETADLIAAKLVNLVRAGTARHKPADDLAHCSGSVPAPVISS